MLLLFLLPFMICFYGDSEIVKVEFDEPKKLDINMAQNKTIEIVTAQVEPALELCGEVPGSCNESMTDINISLNRTVDKIYFSVHNITVISLVTIIIQFITAGIIVKAIYFTKKRFQSNLNQRNRIVPQNVFDPLISGV